MSLSRRIVVNTLFGAGARVVGVALVLISLSFTTRYLGKEGFGEYSLILAFLYIFNALADLGLYSILVRDISRPGAREEKIVGNIFTLRLTGSFLILVLAPLMGNFFPYSAEVKLGIALGTFGYFFLSGSQVLTGVFQKYLHLEMISAAEILGRAVQLAFVVYFVKLDKGLFSLLIAFGLGGLLSFLFTILAARRFVKITLKFNFSFWWKILKESMPLTVSSVLILIYFRLDTILISLFKGSAEVGIYSLAHKVIENLIYFPSVFVGLVMPFLAQSFSFRLERFKFISQRAFDFLLLWIFPLVIGSLFLAPQFISLLGGGQFNEAAGVLRLLIIACAVIFISTLFYNMIIAMSKQRSLIGIYFVGAVLNVCLNLFLIPAYSFFGAAVALVLTELLVLALMALIIWKNLKYLPSPASFKKILAASLAMAFVLYFIRSWNLFLVSGIAALVYFIVLYLIGGIKKEDIWSLFLNKARSA